MPVELRLGARADREGAQQEVERLADRVRVRVRTEVADALALLAAQHHRPRPLLVERDREVRIRLVVLQPDVEARPVLLDEVELEEERLDLVRRRRSTRRGRRPAPSAGCARAAGTAGGSSSRAGCAGSWPCRRRSPGPSASMNWYEPGASGMLPASGRVTAPSRGSEYALGARNRSIASDVPGVPVDQMIAAVPHDR